MLGQIFKEWFKRLVCPHVNIELRQHEYGHAYFCKCCDANIRVRVVDTSRPKSEDGHCCCHKGCTATK